MTIDLDALRSALEEQLEANGVYDASHYRWLNEDDVDPEFAGYAMWVLTPPYDYDFGAWHEDVPPNRAPTAAEQRLMELGHDFFGLEDANLKLTQAISDIVGVSRRAILNALVAGDTVPERLADLTRARLKATRADRLDALHGRSRTTIGS
jgi:hypothetical protein